MTPAAGQWWWATAEPDPDPMPVSLDQPDPRTPGAWWSYVAGCDYAVSVTPLEPVVPYVPWVECPRDGWDVPYDPRPGDMLDGGRLTYTVRAVDGEDVFVTVRFNGADRAERRAGRVEWRAWALGFDGPCRPAPGSVVLRRASDPRAPSAGGVAGGPPAG